MAAFFAQKPKEFVACVIAEMLLVWRKEKNPHHLSTWKRSMKVLTGRGSTDPLPEKKFPGNFVTGRRKNPKSHVGCRSFSTICCFSFSRLGKSWEISEPGESQLTLSRCGKFPDIFEPGAKLESRMSFCYRLENSHKFSHRGQN